MLMASEKERRQKGHRTLVFTLVYIHSEHTSTKILIKRVEERENSHTRGVSPIIRNITSDHSNHERELIIYIKFSKNNPPTTTTTKLREGAGISAHHVLRVGSHCAVHPRR